MLNLILSVDDPGRAHSLDPVRTFGRDDGCMSEFMQPTKGMVSSRYPGEDPALLAC
jgi:hypothetical protein